MRTLASITLAVLHCLATSSQAASELYGNFETMGVIAEPPDGVRADDIDRVAVFLLNDGKRVPMQDAVRVGSTNYFASSLFFLKPNSKYKVALVYLDRTGRRIHEETLTGHTRMEPALSGKGRVVKITPKKPDAFAEAIANAKPGTVIELAGGVYHVGDLTLTAKGTAAKPIVIRSRKGERAILDASDPALLDKGWRKVRGKFWRHAFEGPSNNVCLVERKTGKLIRACPMPSLEDLLSRKSVGRTLDELGIDAAYFCDGKTITLMAPSADLGRYRIHVARRNRALNLEGAEHVFLDGLTFQYYGGGKYSTALFLRHASDVTVQHCQFRASNTGLWIKGRSNRVTVQDCDFIDDLLRWSFRYLKTQGIRYANAVETGAVYADAAYNGRGLVIRHNRMEGLFDGAHIAPSAVRPITVRTSETDFYRNRVVSAVDDLVEVDGVARNVRVFENFMENSISGVSIAQALDGPTWVISNVISRAGNCAGTSVDHLEGYPVKTNGGGGVDVGSGVVFFFHNTSWTFDPRAPAFLIKGARWKKLVFRNNIWMGHTAGWVTWRVPMSPVDMRNDVLFSPKGPALRLGSKHLGPGDHGDGVVMRFLHTDPRLVNADRSDYALKASSPCVDAGVVLPGINAGRFHGKAPDIGAFERGQPPFVTGPRPRAARTLR